MNAKREAKETVEPERMTFLVIDDRVPGYYIARRQAEQVRREFHDMRIGERREIGGPHFSITRES